MPYKDPDKRREYEREKRRRQRAAAQIVALEGTKKNPCPPQASGPIRTPQDVLDVLSAQIRLVESARAETLIRARTIATLANVVLKALEVGDLAARVASLENQLAETENQNHAESEG